LTWTTTPFRAKAARNGKTGWSVARFQAWVARRTCYVDL